MRSGSTISFTLNGVTVEWTSMSGSSTYHGIYSSEYGAPIIDNLLIEKN